MRSNSSIEGVGGNLNAFTAEEETCYYAKVPANHLKQTFDVLADISFFPRSRRKIWKKNARSFWKRSKCTMICRNIMWESFLRSFCGPIILWAKALPALQSR